MRIQEEAPLPPSPLATLESDYGMAVIHLAWDLRRNGEGREAERTLIFAFVELLPAEIPPPEDDYDAKDPRFSKRLGGQSEHRIYVRHAVVKASTARDWYDGCRRGVATLPEDGRILEPDAEGAKRLRLVALDEEPPWPTLLCVADHDTIPFAPDWAESPRVHHLVATTERALDGLWSENEKERAQRWLEERLHFSLAEYPEYWGSVHLVAPNPVYRHIHAGRQQRTEQAVSVALRLEPRAGKRVEGLELIYRGANATGTLYEHTIHVQSPLLRVSFDHRAQPFQTDVIDSARGMLANPHGLRVFIGGFKFSTGFGGRLQVNGPTPESTYTVHRSARSDQGSLMAVPEVVSAEIRMANAALVRSRRGAAARQDQRWFRDQQEAVDVIRDLVNKAEREILLVDPYFGGMELWKFMLAVGSEVIPVRVLSSAAVLVKHRGEEGERLRDVLEQVRSHPRMNPFEVRVMIGARPPVHDWFLLVDGNIWLLGSSLNEIGSRGTVMVALPDPEPIREQLTKVWDAAIVLETWVERRKDSRGADESTGT